MITKSTLFLIPGFKQTCVSCGYQPIIKDLKNKFNIVKCDINWKYTNINDWSKEFFKIYSKNKSDKNIILGFSFGAMIALNSVIEITPNNLILCSLSPYFSEYLNLLPESWKKETGKNRINNFNQISIKKLSKIINDKKINIHLFIGEKELKNWPSMKTAFEENIKLLNPKNKSIISKAKHSIETNYSNELINLLKTL